MKEIKLTFAKDGKTVTKEVDGYAGEKCLSDTKFIDDAIGTVTKTDMKQEFFVPEPVGLDQQNYNFT